MSDLEPERVWWTASQIAEAKLPDLPTTKRRINDLAERERWNNDPELSRRRQGKGGGWEYHWKLLPIRAQLKLLDAAKSTARAQATAEVWHLFEQAPDRDRETARTRLEILQKVEMFQQAGFTKVIAVDKVARLSGISDRTIFIWQERVKFVDHGDELPYLLPRQRLAVRKDMKKPVSKAFMDYLKSLYLRLEGPPFAVCYRLAVTEAEKESWTDIPAQRTAQRRLEADVPRVSRVFLREGEAGLLKCFPPQIRDRSEMEAMEGVNADCHKIDVFVSWPDGRITRPQIIAFQDIYSGKILSWRVDHDPNKVMVMAAFGEMVEEFGIPRHCLVDNGREFANKWFTGGAPTRFRFKVREDDPLGILPMLGIKIHWALPGHGQAKPIERAFRDIANSVAKDPRFAGAYVGNRPDAKPENYGSKAVPIDTFLEVLDEGIAEHNARQGRRSPTCNGRSFDQTFAESYAQARIRKATDAQRALWLMAQHVGKLHKDNGQLQLHGNFYYADWMSEIAGQKVVARFNPEDLHAGVHIFDLDGVFLGYAECRQKVGFFDLTGAREAARKRARILKAEKALAKEYAPVPIEEIAAGMGGDTPAPAHLEAKVVAPEFRGTAKRPSPKKPSFNPPETPELDAQQEALILEMEERRKAQIEKEKETPADRFWQAMDILKRMENGEPIGTWEAGWIARYQDHPEFTSRLSMFELYGEIGVH
ncbi:transposase domain-containing protein [Thalassococcus sp. S3]|uniref:transposase domain-containing protein n=1 Tax=Thalassococcus sp. S3 TaxID=2017482 RepID=UPI0010242C03|nr:transposase domain-containing protein [Thalassococcus sp. S3]QBF31536.1 transposase [Thalassococcus sp. S3]